MRRTGRTGWACACAAAPHPIAAIIASAAAIRLMDGSLWLPAEVDRQHIWRRCALSGRRTVPATRVFVAASQAAGRLEDPHHVAIAARARIGERGHALAVRPVGIGPGLLQRLDDPGVIRAAVADHDGLEQRGPSPIGYVA